MPALIRSQVCALRRPVAAHVAVAAKGIEVLATKLRLGPTKKRFCGWVGAHGASVHVEAAEVNDRCVGHVAELSCRLFRGLDSLEVRFEPPVAHVPT